MRALRSQLLSLGAVCLTVLAAAGTATPDAPRADRTKLALIPDRIGAFVAKQEIAGAVTLVATTDGVVHLEPVGLADIAHKTPMRTDAIFWIASMTKPITASAVLMLQDEGKLSVDDPVGKYLPALGALKTADGSPARVTIRHLLTHTSGLPEATGAESAAARTLADLIPAYARGPLGFEPGSKWQYCQSGINSAARIVEIVSGQAFPDFLRDRLFRPLGMADTTFYPTPEQLPRIAKSYKRVEGGLEEVPIFLLAGKDPAARDRYPAANGGLFSTAMDYARFCRMILGGGSLDGVRYLKPESVQLMTTVQTGDLQTGFTPGNGWGLGWCVVRAPQGVSAGLAPGAFGHGGAYGTQAWIDPGKGAIYLLMVQRANFPNADASDVRRVFQETAAAALR